MKQSPNTSVGYFKEPLTAAFVLTKHSEKLLFLTVVFACLCSACSVSSSTNNIRVQNGGTYPKGISERIKVNVYENGNLVDSFTGEKNIRLFVNKTSTLYFELEGIDEEAKQCIYTKKDAVTDNIYHTDDYEPDPVTAGFIQKCNGFCAIMELGTTVSTTNSTMIIPKVLLSPSDTTTMGLWHYNYPNFMQYYPAVKDTEECRMWLESLDSQNSSLKIMSSNDALFKDKESEEEPVGNSDK